MSAEAACSEETSCTRAYGGWEETASHRNTRLVLFCAATSYTRRLPKIRANSDITSYKTVASRPPTRAIESRRFVNAISARSSFSVSARKPSRKPVISRKAQRMIIREGSSEVNTRRCKVGGPKATTAACDSSNAAPISAVAIVSTNPHRKAAAIMAKRKNRKKTLLGGLVNRHNSDGQRMSLAWAQSTSLLPGGRAFCSKARSTRL